MRQDVGKVFEKRHASTTSVSIEQIKPTFEQSAGAVLLGNNIPILNEQDKRQLQKRVVSRIQARKRSVPASTAKSEKRKKVSIEQDRHSVEDKRDGRRDLL